jgi:hypothetical protein
VDQTTVQLYDSLCYEKSPTSIYQLQRSRTTLTSWRMWRPKLIRLISSEMNKASLLSHLGDIISEILYILLLNIKDNKRYGGLLHVRLDIIIVDELWHMKFFSLSFFILSWFACFHLQFFSFLWCKEKKERKKLSSTSAKENSKLTWHSLCKLRTFFPRTA